MAMLPAKPYLQRRFLRREEDREQTRRVANVQAHHNRLDTALQRWAGTPKEPEPVEYDLESLDIQRPSK